MDSAVSIWVGIDGYMPMAAPLIQAGVNVEYASDGSMFYNAFTEVSLCKAFYPHYFKVSLTRAVDT